MGLFSAFNAGVSGANGATKSVECIAQNIGSADAVASKKREAFHSVINTGSTINNFSPSGVSSNIQHFISTVGTPTGSDVDTHMAIQGQGMFIVNNNAGGTTAGGSTSFSRDGTFAEDKSGNFVNQAGQYLQMFKTDASGVIQATDQSTTTQMVTATSQGLSGNQTATTMATLNGINLSATAVNGTSKDIPFQVWDSLGVSHTISLNFTKSAQSPATWTVTALPTADGTFDAKYTSPGFDIVFDTNGNIASIDTNTAAPPANNAPQMTITWNSPAAASILTIDFGVIGAPGGVTATGATADLSTPIAIDGRGSAKYVSTTIDGKTGNLIAKFDDNSDLIYGKIPLATFKDTNKLLEQSGGIYYPTPESGPPIINQVAQRGAGSLLTSQYETSTIDSAEAFTGLIIQQQLYTTNLKLISTVEEMLTSLTRTLGS